jgi:hypothetical protein
VVPAALLQQLVSTAGVSGSALNNTISSSTLKGYLNSASQRLERYIGDFKRGFAIIIVAGPRMPCLRLLLSHPSAFLPMECDSTAPALQSVEKRLQ